MSMDTIAINTGYTELHCHIDGSLRPATFLELYDRVSDGKGRQFKTMDDIEDSLCFQEGWDLPRCLKSFGTTQEAENLERVTYELYEDLFIDGVRFAELRNCPSLHL